MPERRSSRFIGRILDAFIPGDAYNDVTGRWNPATTRVGLMGMGAGQLVPGGGYIVQQGAQRGWFGENLAKQLRNEYVYNQLSGQLEEVRRDALSHLTGRVDVPNVGFAATGRPQMMSGAGTPPPGQPEQPGSLGTSTGNVFKGGSLGSWANQQPTGARPIGGMLSFSGGRAGYNNGVGAGTGFGATSYQNDSWGTTAAGFGIGATNSSSAGSIALADAQRAAKLNKV